MISQKPYCLALHLRKQPHKHDNRIRDVEHWHRCITQHREHSFVPVYSLHCFDKLLHTTTGASSLIEFRMKRLYGKSRERKRRKTISLQWRSWRSSILNRKQAEETTSRSEEKSPAWPPFLSHSYCLCLFPSLVDAKFTRRRWQTADYELPLTDVEERVHNVACGLDANCLVSQNAAGWRGEERGRGLVWEHKPFFYLFWCCHVGLGNNED